MGSYGSKESYFAQVDIISDEERKTIDENIVDKYQVQFYQFVQKYKDSFHKKEEKNKYYVNSLLKNHQTERSNISVLVILSSNNEEYNISDIATVFKTSFFKNSGDIATALLICHLFRNAYGIPLSQMLITNTEKAYLDQDSFSYYQNVNIGQIGEKQYKFILDKQLLSRIKQFSYDTIEKELKSNESTNLFVFFLDHGSRANFGNKTYQYFLESLLKIPCQRFYVFNDSCHSTSMIALIRASIEFEKIFSKSLDPKISSALFHFLGTIGHINDDFNFFKESFNSAMKIAIENNDPNNPDKNYGDIIQYQNEIKQIIYEVYQNHELQAKLISMIVDDLSGISCFPRVFDTFGKKATIFTSSLHGSIALTLPFRRIHITNHTQYRACGSIFASVFIESLLTAPKSLNLFLRSVNILFRKYKESFQAYIIKQNKKTPNIKTNNLASENQVINFFNIKPSDQFHFFCSSSDWPDLELIYINNEYWNVDASIVDVKEYEKIYLGDFLTRPSIPPNTNKNSYGPSDDISRLAKFLYDFQNEVNLVLNQNEIYQKFNIDPEEENEDKILKGIQYSLGTSAWAFFYSGIRKYVLTNLDRGVVKLQYPIIIYFNDKNIPRKAISMFVNAYKTIFNYWKYYSL